MKKSIPDLRCFGASLCSDLARNRRLSENKCSPQRDRQLFLHSLAVEIDIEPREGAKSTEYQVGVGGVEVFEEVRDINPLPRHQLHLSCAAPG